VLVTDKLGSYQAARRSVLASVEHRQSKYLNNRAENSHQPTRVRERAMKKFSSPGGAQRFLAAFSVISTHFRTRRHLLHARNTAARWPAASVPEQRHRADHHRLNHPSGPDHPTSTTH
jgi:transposase-like protein